MILSVIIPVFNASAFIGQCFHILEKDFPADAEVIFIDDGSTDGSRASLLAYAETHSHVQVLHKVNGGAASARNAGVRAATGQYIAFLDADDTLDFKALTELLLFSVDRNLDICAYGYNYIAVNGMVTANQLKHPVRYNTIDSGLSFLQQGYQPSSICVFLLNRRFLLSNNLFFYEGITHEDVEISLKYFLAAKHVYFSEQVIYNYYQTPGSVTNQVTAAKKERYLLDEVTVATLMKENLGLYSGAAEQEVIKKNYNSVTWNLLFQMITDRAAMNYDFKLKTLSLLEEQGLYPIKGPLKTRSQHWSRLLFNLKPVMKHMLKAEGGSSRYSRLSV